MPDNWEMGRKAPYPEGNRPFCEAMNRCPASSSISNVASIGLFISSDLTKRLASALGSCLTSHDEARAILHRGNDSLEQYRDTGGLVLNRFTVSLSAMLMGGSGQPISLNMKLMDFRIMRSDLARANAGPRSRTEESTKF